VPVDEFVFGVVDVPVAVLVFVVDEVLVDVWVPVPVEVT
jgi:hypothetical protein